MLKGLTCHLSSFLSGSRSETDEVQPSSTSIRKTSRFLATEICGLKTASGTVGQDAVRVLKTMRIVANEMLTKHRIVFDKYVRIVVETSRAQGVDRGLERVLVDMFKDGDVNWGRVIAVYAFAQHVVQYCVQQGTMDVANKIADVTAKFIEDNLTEWIVNQGGWDSFEKQFQQENTTESKMWNGLVVTLLGLGTLATITALK